MLPGQKPPENLLLEIGPAHPASEVGVFQARFLSHPLETVIGDKHVTREAYQMLFLCLTEVVGAISSLPSSKHCKFIVPEAEFPSGETDPSETDILFHAAEREPELA